MTIKKKVHNINMFVDTYFPGAKHKDRVTAKQFTKWFMLDFISKDKLPFTLRGWMYIDKEKFKAEVLKFIKKSQGKYILKTTFARELVRQYPTVSVSSISKELSAVVPEQYIVLRADGVVVYFFNRVRSLDIYRADKGTTQRHKKIKISEL